MLSPVSVSTNRKLGLQNRNTFWLLRNTNFRRIRLDLLIKTASLTDKLTQNFTTSVADSNPKESENLAGSESEKKSRHYFKINYVKNYRSNTESSVADPDPGSGAFLPPGSEIRIRDEFFPDPGSFLVMTKTLLLKAKEARKK
jgi:hypothetical protein